MALATFILPGPLSVEGVERLVPLAHGARERGPFERPLVTEDRMSSTTLIEQSVEKAPAKGPGTEGDVKTDKKAPATKVGKFFKKDSDEDDEKVLKWRFLAKGPALTAILAFFGARAVEGDKQVAFKVDEADDMELGEVVRYLFTRAHAAGVTLGDLVALIEEREATQKDPIGK